jgi:hypothetical protein
VNNASTNVPPINSQSFTSSLEAITHQRYETGVTTPPDPDPSAPTKP